MTDQDSLTSFKNDLVRTESEARAFLERELEKRNISFSVSEWEVYSHEGYQSINIAIEPTHKPSPGEPEFIFYVKANAFGGVLNIKVFGVSPHPFGMRYENDPYKGKNLGLVGMKALIGIVQPHLGSIDKIHLKKVEADGPRFWSYLGGFPVVSESYSALSVDGLKQVLLTGLSRQPEDSCAVLREIAGWASEFPALAYRAVSQIKPSKAMRDAAAQICNVAIECLCKSGDDEMIIDLKDLSTLKIWRQRIGALPLCPVPVSFGDVAYETARKNNDRPSLERIKRFEDMRRRNYQRIYG